MAACGRCSCTPSDGLYFNLVSFTDQEADTIVVRRFVKGSNFTQLADTLLVDENNLRFSRSNDTLSMASSGDGAAVLHPSYDHEMYFPAVSKTTRVSDMSEERASQPCGPFTGGKVGCMNPIRSVNLDGQRVTIDDRNWRLFIRK